MKETIQALAVRLQEIKEKYLYELTTPENIHSLEGECRQAVENANQVLNGYNVNAEFYFECIQNAIYAHVEFKDMITGQTLNPDYVN